MSIRVGVQTSYWSMKVKMVTQPSTGTTIMQVINTEMEGTGGTGRKYMSDLAMAPGRVVIGVTWSNGVGRRT